MIQVIPLMHKIVDVIRGLTEFLGNGFQTCENRLTRWSLKRKQDLKICLIQKWNLCSRLVHVQIII